MVFNSLSKFRIFRIVYLHKSTMILYLIIDCKFYCLTRLKVMKNLKA